MIFMNYCYALIDNDPSIEFTEAKEQKKKFLSRAKTYLEAVTCVWEEEEKVTGPARFEFKASIDNPDFDTKCGLSQNDKHEIVSYIEKDKDVTDDSLKAATRKGILSACKTRSQAIELMELYDNVSTTRQIAAACRKFRAQGYGTRTRKKKLKVVDNSAELLELQQKNKEAAEAILFVAAMLELSDYQRASAVRAVSNCANVSERASILQAVLAKEDPKIIRNATSSRHVSFEVLSESHLVGFISKVSEPLISTQDEDVPHIQRKFLLFRFQVISSLSCDVMKYCPRSSRQGRHD
eukprot:g8621.t1